RRARSAELHRAGQAPERSAVQGRPLSASGALAQAQPHVPSLRHQYARYRLERRDRRLHEERQVGWAGSSLPKLAAQPLAAASFMASERALSSTPFTPSSRSTNSRTTT